MIIGITVIRAKVKKVKKSNRVNLMRNYLKSSKKKSLDLQYQKLIKLLEMRIWLERKVQKSNLKNAKIIQINAKGRLV